MIPFPAFSSNLGQDSRNVHRLSSRDGNDGRVISSTRRLRDTIDTTLGPFFTSALVMRISSSIIVHTILDEKLKFSTRDTACLISVVFTLLPSRFKLFVQL